jgi:hypothetical protein
VLDWSGEQRELGSQFSFQFSQEVFLEWLRLSLPPDEYWAIDTHPPVPQQKLWVSCQKANLPNLTKLPILIWIYSWIYSSIFSYEYVHCWVDQIYWFALEIHSLDIVEMSIVAIVTSLWMYSWIYHSCEYIKNVRIAIWKFSQLHWFPLNSCHFLFCQHFSVFKVRFLCKFSNSIST